MKSTAGIFFLFSVLIVCAVFSAGCGWTEPPGYHQAHTLILTKVSQYESVEWTKKYDALGDVKGNLILETVQGNFLVFAYIPNPEHLGAYQGQLILISPDGTVLSRNTTGSEQCTYAPFVDSHGEIQSVGGNGICKISQDGFIQSKLSIPFSSVSGIETKDGGYLILGYIEERRLQTKEEFTKRINGAQYSEKAWQEMCLSQIPPNPVCYRTVQRITIVKTDSSGNELWRYIHDNGGFLDSFGPVFEAPDDRSVTVFAQYDDVYENGLNQKVLLRLTANGDLISVTNFDQIPVRRENNSSQLDLPKEYVVLDPPFVIHFNQTGAPVAKRDLGPGYSFLTQVSDDSFIFVLNGNLVEIDSTGDNTGWSAGLPSSAIYAETHRIFPTRDGGYLVMSDTRRSSTTWP